MVMGNMSTRLLLLVVAIKTLIGVLPSDSFLYPPISSASTWTRFATFAYVQDEGSYHGNEGDIDPSSNRLVVFGLGNIGSIVAGKSSSLGKHSFIDGNCGSDTDGNVTTRCEMDFFFDDVYGVVRNASKTDFEEKGRKEFPKNRDKSVQTIELSSSNVDCLTEILSKCTHVLVTVPPIDPDDVMKAKSTVHSTSTLRSMSNNTTFLSNENDYSEIISIGGRPRQWKFFCDPILHHPQLFPLSDLIPANAWVGYISTTAVYGNHDGEWVTEDSELKYKGGKAEIYHRAEEEWRREAHRRGWSLHIFRCAGLYGNGRSALHTIRKKMKSNGDIGKKDSSSDGSSVTVLKESYPVSRIHEEDVCRAILSSMRRHAEGEGDRDGYPTINIWNLADDDPSPRSEVFAFASKMIDDANLLPSRDNSTVTIRSDKSQLGQKKSERERRRSTDRKRVDNRRMKKFLLPDGQLLYPTYKEGLRSIMNYNREDWERNSKL